MAKAVAINKTKWERNTHNPKLLHAKRHPLPSGQVSIPRYATLRHLSIVPDV